MNAACFLGCMGSRGLRTRLCSPSTSMVHLVPVSVLARHIPKGTVPSEASNVPFGVGPE